MGKGIIKSGGDEGLYSVELTLHKERIDAIIVIIDAQIAKLDTKIFGMETEIFILEMAIWVMPEGDEKEKKKKELKVLVDAKDLEKLKRASYQKKKDYLNDNMPDDPTVQAWCGDFTEDLSGTVGTIEIPGERGMVQIQPGHEGGAAYNTERDGQLQPSIASTPAATFYNLAMMPGWQKWMPTYRHGIISNIDTDNDTCDVTLYADKSSQQGLSINQESKLPGIPIEYMSCNSGAFENGDSVLVKFKEQKQSGAKVIGFVDKPKQCEFYIDITINGKQPEYIKTLKIIDKNDDEYVASSSENDPTDDLKKPWKVGPFEGVVWPAKIYLENSGGLGGALFSYFTEVPAPAPEDPPVGYLVAKIGHGNYCNEEWGRSQLNCYFFGSYTPDGSEILAVPAEQVGYLLHGTFDSKPDSPIAFTIKVLGRLQTKSTGFSGCSSCSPASESFNWADDADQIIFANNVFGTFPGSCRVTYHLEYCSSFLICTAASQWNSYNTCSLSNMAIMTDEEGQNPVFDETTVSVGFFAWDVYCQEIDENGDWVSNICYAANVAVSDADNYEWKMLPTPEDRI